MFNRRQVLSLFVPAFIERALIVSAGFIATFMMAGVSEFAVSGVGLVETINILITSVLIALSAGATVVVSQLIGAGDIKSASKAAGQAVSATLAVSVAVSVLAVVFARPAVEFVFAGAEQEVLDNAAIYFMFSGLSYPFLATATALSSVFRAARNAKTPMLGSGLGEIIHLITVVAAVKFFNMGVYGAGLSLVLTRMTALAFMYFSVKRGSLEIHMPRLTLRFDRAVIGRLLNIAVPSGFDSFMFAGGKLLIARFLNGFGTDYITANAINTNIFNIVSLPSEALFLISMTIIGQLYGAEKYKEVRKFMYILTGLTAGVLLITCGGFFPLLRPFIGIYGLPGATNAIIYETTAFCFLFMPLLWPTSFAVPQLLRGTGDVKYTMWVSMVSMFAVRVFGAWFFGVYLEYKLMGIWIAMIIDWAVRSAFFVPRAFMGYWNKEGKGKARKRAPVDNA